MASLSLRVRSLFYIRTKVTAVILEKIMIRATQQERQCTYKLNAEARPCNHFCSGKAMGITVFFDR
jgi:hypothetical protein